MIENLKARYPALSFETVGNCHYPRCEDATYLNGRTPQGRTEFGDFVRIENPMGGSDTYPADRHDLIEAAAKWHQSRATARGF